MIAVFRKQVLVVAVALFCLAPGLVRAEAVGTFTKIEGSVDILRPGAVAAAPVQTGDPVGMGDAVRTKRNGKAEIQFRDESVIQLAPETRITIDQYSFRPDNTREKGFLSLLRGKIRAVVSKIRASIVSVSGTDSNFNIKTPTAVAGVKGTDFLVYYDRGVTGVIFLEGFGFAYNPDRPGVVVPVRAGQATFVPSATEPPTKPVNVSDAFIAPHLRDTTISGSHPEGAPEGEGQPFSTFTSLNTTYQALTEQGMSGEGPKPRAPGQPGSATNVQPPPPPPVTTTHPDLLGTPVKVNVKVP